MNTIFESITDATLRRIYKLVLKRTIGKYLEDELLIDQLQVQSRDGKFFARNLRLSPDLLNEEVFNQTPIKLLSLVIEELSVAISYSSLVSDGLQLDISSINVAVCPNLNIATPREFSDSDESDDDIPADRSSTHIPATDTSDEGKEGLSFVGTWIEVIVAKLRATIKEVNISLFSNEKVSEDSCFLKISLQNLSFFNADPSGEAHGSSMQLSRSVMSSMYQSTAINSLSSTKVM